MITNATELRHRAKTMDVSFALSPSAALENELKQRVEKGEVISAEVVK